MSIFSGKLNGVCFAIRKTIDNRFQVIECEQKEDIYGDIRNWCWSHEKKYKTENGALKSLRRWKAHFPTKGLILGTLDNDQFTGEIAIK
jgi:hypothetical protein